MNRRVSVLGSRSLVIAAVVALSACGGSSSSSTASTDSIPTTDAASDGPVNPLLGTPLVDPAVATRPAMVVKIDNHPSARPQAGINQADIIFEENVEKLTRYAAVFHSEGSDPVGPIRSGRFQDINLVGSLNKPLFVWSGGNRQVSSAIGKSDLVDLSYLKVNNDGGFTRNDEYRAPHNLFAETTKLWTLAPAGSSAPSTQFAYRTVSDANASTSKEALGLKVSMDGVKVQWDWDAAAKEWVKTQDGTIVVDPADVALSVPNVIVLEVEYTNTYSPISKTLGSGKAYVFTNGVVYEGTWSRTDRLKPFELKDSAGGVIKLTPGQTFVEVARAGKTAVVTPGMTQDEVKFP
jgi:hypothetical protein